MHKRFGKQITNCPTCDAVFIESPTGCICPNAAMGNCPDGKIYPRPRPSYLLVLAKQGIGEAIWNRKGNEERQRGWWINGKRYRRIRHGEKARHWHNLSCARNAFVLPEGHVYAWRGNLMNRFVLVDFVQSSNEEPQQ